MKRSSRQCIYTALRLDDRTPDQKAASRANGTKSRGPVTPQGKLNSASNSSRHGILARTVLLEGESRQRFNSLMTSLYEELQPETAIETLLVQKMAVSQWRQMRLWGMEKASILHEVRRQQPSVSLEDPPTRDALASHPTFRFNLRSWPSFRYMTTRIAEMRRKSTARFEPRLMISISGRPAG